MILPARRAMAVSLCLAVLTCTCSFAKTVHPQKVRLKFIATSTFVRGTWGMNEDIYLVELTDHKNGNLNLLRLIDTYSNLVASLPFASITAKSGTTLAIVRDLSCDLPYGRMVLRTAPGDPLAILPERLGYKPQFDHDPNPDQIIPCYRTTRR